MDTFESGSTKLIIRKIFLRKFMMLFRSKQRIVGKERLR
jgi:hypothetical protein